MENENIVSGAASTDVAASYSDEDFLGGFSESFGFTPERSEEENAESAEVNEPEEVPKEPVGDKGAEGTPGAPEGEGQNAAASGDKDPETPESFVFKEHGKEFSAPKEAVEAFAKAVGRTPESLIDIYQKGCNYDALSGKMEEIRKENELFDRMAGARKIPKEQLRDELISALENIPVENLVNEILEENPGMKKETARELAKFRIGEQKPKAEEPKAENINQEENEGKLRELEIFEANHPEAGKLKREVIAAWEKSGISLEDAYNNFRIKEENEQLRAQVSALEKEKQQKQQKAYAYEHSAGSVGSPTGKIPKDEFIEGLFAEY